MISKFFGYVLVVFYGAFISQALFLALIYLLNIKYSDTLFTIFMFLGLVATYFLRNTILKNIMSYKAPFSKKNKKIKDIKQRENDEK